MIVLDSEQIDKLIDRNEMMDQIEEAYKIFKAGDYYNAAASVCRRCEQDNDVYAMLYEGSYWNKDFKYLSG